ncbi:hypothetical protein EMIT0P260_90273 [Pseudomonas sp. IT-P260]
MTSMINVKQSKGDVARCRHWQDEVPSIPKRWRERCQTFPLPIRENRRTLSSDSSTTPPSV